MVYFLSLLYAPLDLDIKSNGHIFLTNFNGIDRSTDEGNSWQLVYGPTTSVNCLEILSNENLLAGTAAQGPYISTNNGTTWSPSNNGLNQTVISLRVDKTNEDIYAGTFYNGVYKSTDNGSSWFRSLFLDEYIKCFTIADNGDIYTGAVGFAKVFRSSNNGSNWQQVFSLSNNITTADVLLDLPNGNILVGTGGSGIFQTSDNGISWTAFNEGLTSLDIYDLALDSQNFILTATESAGIFKRALVTGLQNPISTIIPNEYELYQNYPNPFNPTTVIRYSLIENSFTTLVIHDVLGNEVATLVNQIQNPGSYEIEFNGSNLPSGLYFYSLLVDGNIINTKSMVLLK